MKFQNISPHDLRFNLDGVMYEVPVGGSCQVHDRIAYAVTSRGLPLKPIVDTTPEPKPEPAPEARHVEAPASQEATKPKRK